MVGEGSAVDVIVGETLGVFVGGNVGVLGAGAVSVMVADGSKVGVGGGTAVLVGSGADVGVACTGKGCGGRADSGDGDGGKITVACLSSELAGGACCMPSSLSLASFSNPSSCPASSDSEGVAVGRAGASGHAPGPIIPSL
jgi:hypothetical protein